MECRRRRRIKKRMNGYYERLGIEKLISCTTHNRSAGFVRCDFATFFVTLLHHERRRK